MLLYLIERTDFMNKKPIIIDCDPGIDDAIMLFTALQCEELDILGITTVAGNVSLNKTTQNALDILDYCKSSVPVYRGMAKPLSDINIDASHIHGDDGLKGVLLPKSDTKANEDAVSFMAKELLNRPNEIELLAVGPLTNIAELFTRFPRTIDCLDRLVIMGGGHAMGNITPSAEFNIYADVTAAEIVFSSGVEIHMIGLDVTMLDGLSKKELSSLYTKHNAQTQTISSMLDRMVFAEGALFPPFAFIHDAMALIYVLDPSIVQMNKHAVAIETNPDSIAYGRTVVDVFHVTGDDKNTFVASNLDKDKYKEILFKKLRKYQ